MPEKCSSCTIYACSCSERRKCVSTGESRGLLCAGLITVDDSRNPSHLAELIPHHNHSSLDGLSPVDILKPAHDRCAPARAPIQGHYSMVARPVRVLAGAGCDLACSGQ